MSGPSPGAVISVDLVVESTGGATAWCYGVGFWRVGCRVQGKVAWMPRSRNRLDGRRVYFEDEGGDAVPVAFHGGFLDSVADVRESNIAQSSTGRATVVDVDPTELASPSARNSALGTSVAARCATRRRSAYLAREA